MTRALPIIFFAAASLYGGTIINTFPDTTTNTTILGQAGFGIPAWASEFRPGQTYDLTSVEVALGYVSGTNAATVEIVSDNSGVPGASVLESWSLTNVANSPFGEATGVQPTETLDDGTGLVLNADTNYWLEVVQGDSTTVMTLQDTDASAPNPAPIFRLQGGNWIGPNGVSMTMDIEGLSADAPEPATFPMLAGLLVGVSLLRRRLLRQAF